MSDWIAETGENITVREIGLYIDGEYLPDKEGPTHDADA